MPRLLMFVTLLLLLSSCGGISQDPVPPKPISLCRVPVLPPKPALHPRACTDTEVCIDVGEVVSLVLWSKAVDEVELALKGCNLVERIP